MTRPSLKLYALLGLPPTADRKAVERAYRQLMKVHHPDLEGGDPARAADINQAYAILKDPEKLAAFDRAGERPAPIRMRRARRPVTLRPRPRKGKAGALVLGMLVLAATGYAAGHPRLFRGLRIAALFDDPDPLAHNRPNNVAIDAPINHKAVIYGARLGLKLAAQPGLSAATSYSRDCQRMIRIDPAPALLDQCVAFDAAVSLSASDDDGIFGSASTSARQITAARQFSDDLNRITHRIDLIRGEVEVIASGGYFPPEAPAAGARDGAG